uniref:Uncharacterized protein n=1 Tax=Pyxicephalus adspersus TaxID=30357 RepID=A0AAV3AYI0_PYXAD|nr:TPA: hypothetical protein GDO54_006738 [Pyxicephalus adspersus]
MRTATSSRAFFAVFPEKHQVFLAISPFRPKKAGCEKDSSTLFFTTISIMWLLNFFGVIVMVILSDKQNLPSCVWSLVDF